MYKTLANHIRIIFNDKTSLVHRFCARGSLERAESDVRCGCMLYYESSATLQQAAQGGLCNVKVYTESELKALDVPSTTMQAVSAYDPLTQWVAIAMVTLSKKWPNFAVCGTYDIEVDRIKSVANNLETFANIITPPDEPVVIKRCASCNLSRIPLRKCGGCSNVYYCCVSCQKSHWAVHKTQCAKLKKIKEAIKCAKKPT